MELLYGGLKELQQWSIQLSSCFGQPMQAPECRPFWIWIMLGLFATGAIAIGYAVWKIISYQLKLAAALKAQAERERVDRDAIEGSKWQGDEAYIAELGGEEVERRIREVVNQRQLAEAAERDKLNVV